MFFFSRNDGISRWLRKSPDLSPNEDLIVSKKKHVENALINFSKCCVDKERGNTKTQFVKIALSFSLFSISEAVQTGRKKERTQRMGKVLLSFRNRMLLVSLIRSSFRIRTDVCILQPPRERERERDRERERIKKSPVLYWDLRNTPPSFSPFVCDNVRPVSVTR